MTYKRVLRRDRGPEVHGPRPATEIRLGRTSCEPRARQRRYPSQPSLVNFPILRGMSTVVNQHETHTTSFKHSALPAADKTAGANSVVKGAQAFEQRATQEQGTH